jgi:hypothetical protein
MSPTIRCFICAAAFSPLTLVTFDAQGAGDVTHPTAVEIVQLPKFCWKQMGALNATGPEFSLPAGSDCGGGTNHYCSGLVALMRAKVAASKGQRVSMLGRADTNVRYTENWIKDYPNCSIRDHVAASRAEVNHLMTIFGFDRPRAR